MIDSFLPFKGMAKSMAVDDSTVKLFSDIKEAYELKEQAVTLPSLLKITMDRLMFFDALKEIWLVIDRANVYIETTAPWKLAKAKKDDELCLVIQNLAEVLKIVAQAVWPFMPTTGESIWVQLGLSGKPNSTPFDGKWGFFIKGGKIAKGASLFPRIETEKKPT